MGITRHNGLMTVLFFLATFPVSVPAIADSPALYYRLQRAHAPNVKACVSQAYDTMKKEELTSLKRDDQHAGGRTSTTHAAITCLATTNGITAVIMVAGEGSKEVLERLGTQLDKFVMID